MKSIAIVVCALGLSLATWFIFYRLQMPLDSRATAVVAGFWLLAAILAKWAGGRLSTVWNKKKTRKTIKVLFLLLTSLGARLTCQEVSPPSTITNKPLMASSALNQPIAIACSPEWPTVRANGTLRIKIWENQPDSLRPQLVWTATAGSIELRDKDIVWNFSGNIHEGIYFAVGHLSNSVACSIRVVVVDSDRNGLIVRDTARSYLTKNSKESTGYGLYSYVLFGSHPSVATRGRYLRVLASYITMIDPISELAKHLQHEDLNITYLPVMASPPTNVTPQWLLDHYDYARARAYLDMLSGRRKAGIYIISRRQPLAANDQGQGLYQDLSTVPTVPDDLINWWIREFMSQAAQTNFQQPDTGELFSLKLRTTIAVLAEGLPAVQDAIKGWVKWTE